MLIDQDIAKYVLNNLRETPRLVEDSIKQNNRYLPKRKAYKRIREHLDSFVDYNSSQFFEKERWILLPGLRGTGKTTLVFQLYNYLLNERKIPLENILYLTADDVKSYLGADIQKVIYSYLRNIHRTTPVELDKKIIIIIDEAHFDEKWELSVKTIFDKTKGNKNIFFIVTGSSSISLEAGVDSVRRRRKENLYPLNFQEYLVLKYNFYPPQGTANSIKNVILRGNSLAIDKLINIENELNKKILTLYKSIDNEIINFIFHGGFPFCIRINPAQIYIKVAEVIDKIIQKDLPKVYSYNIQTQDDILKILMFLSLKRAGDISISKLANSVGISSRTVSQILNALEKTQLIFSLKPFQGAHGTIRDAWRYYFLSPTIKSSLLFKFGRLDQTDEHIFGELVEQTVASYFYRMMKTTNSPTGISFDNYKICADFLLHYADINIPVEVGSGKKDKKQTSKTGQRNKNINHKIIISDEENTKVDGDTIYIPLKTFLFS